MLPDTKLHFEEMLKAIEQRAHGRYSVTGGGDLAFSDDTPDIRKHICRLRRVGKAAGHRTILVVQPAYSDSQLQAAFGWAADVREQLPEPETADLYMIMIIDGVADEDAGRIETDDRFCRKIVLRSNEAPIDLLDRTFLGSISAETISSSMGDPLQTSLDALGHEHSWTRKHLQTWREILLSGKTGADLGQSLVSVLPGMEIEK